MDGPTLKLVQKLKDKSRKIMYKHNSKLRDTHRHICRKEVNNDKHKCGGVE